LNLASFKRREDVLLPEANIRLIASIRLDCVAIAGQEQTCSVAPVLRNTSRRQHILVDGLDHYACRILRQVAVYGVTEIRRAWLMAAHRYRTEIAIMVAAGLVAQLLVWATHTHAHSMLGNSSLRCQAVVHAAGNVPCLPHNEQDDCEICCNLVSAGSVLVPPLLTPSPPKRDAERLQQQAVRRLLPAKLFVGYRSRAPPLLLAS
jgi:hypothetical protein